MVGLELQSDLDDVKRRDEESVLRRITQSVVERSEG